MRLSRFSVLALTALHPGVLAQVPASLSKAFNTQLQVNFNGDSASGFNDGATVPFTDTSNQPVFALGDASGVNTRISYLIMMLDTTDENNFIMHYLQTDYKASGEKTGLATNSVPKVPYAGPGSFGESGARKYTFLLYLQRNSDLQSNPQAGEKFDNDAFGTANNLEPPVAGVAMTVNVGDTSASGASSSSPTPNPSDGAIPAPAGAPTTPPVSTTSSSSSSETQTVIPDSVPVGGDVSVGGSVPIEGGVFIGGGVLSYIMLPVGFG